MPRSGYADLPLHYGRVPAWLAQRMTKLGGAIVEALVMEYGKPEVLKRLSDFLCGSRQPPRPNKNQQLKLF